MSHNKIILGVAILLSASFTSEAQDKVLTLQDAINLSIQNSKNLKISNARIEEATAVVKEATDSRLPDFKISGSYIRLNNANIDMKSASQGSSNGGGTPSINQAVYGIANISLPIYTGGKIKYGIESARYLEKATRLDAEKDKTEIIFNTTKAYINLYKAFQAVVLVKENLQSSLSRDSNFANLEKNGLLARNDLLKSQLQSSSIELSELEAANNYKIATVNMNLMLGLPEQDPIMIDTSFINSSRELKTFEEYEDIALQNRKDIQAAALRKKAAESNIRSAKAEAYPNIALTGGYIAADIPHFISITNAVNIGIGIQYNLASLWKSNTRLQKAKAQEKQAIAGQDILNDAVRLSINQDYQNYLLSLKKTELYEKALVQATENYRITNNKYNNSLVTLTDLLDANVAKLQAKLNIAMAKADAVLAYNKLLQTAGLL
ncbi:MAG: TolC family protein [Bacteroidetes bacterium]|nr:TolC family protein [Bacteroidota bacterium]